LGIKIKQREKALTAQNFKEIEGLRANSFYPCALKTRGQWPRVNPKTITILRGVSPYIQRQGAPRSVMSKNSLQHALLGLDDALKLGNFHGRKADHTLGPHFSKGPEFGVKVASATVKRRKQ
jgi:hypothetical protein